MKPEEVAELLKGKTIAEIKYRQHLDMCIDSIIFTDGTVIEPWGQADECRLSDIITPDGKYHVIEGVTE